MLHDIFILIFIYKVNPDSLYCKPLIYPTKKSMTNIEDWFSACNDSSIGASFEGGTLTNLLFDIRGLLRFSPELIVCRGVPRALIYRGLYQ